MYSPIVSNAQPSSLHPNARSGAIMPWWRFISLLTQRESRKELDFLTPQRADDLFEAWIRGETAEVQLVWDRLEKFDSTLFACVRARLSALGEMKWTVNVDADAVGDDAAMQQLADKQRLFLLRCLSDVENLTEAISALGKADFTGVAALELTGNTERMRWETINPWHLCRPSLHAPWMYNANADPIPRAPELLEEQSVILREAPPMHLPIMFLIVAKRHGVQAWDAFLDKFGIPAAFFETPPGSTEQQALEFDAVVQKLIGEGSGVIPSGAKLHTFETGRDNTQTFEARARWCDDAILQLTLGGKLTMATESGSGTLAGNAHQESFERLCSSSARSISECINRQFCRRILRSAFPGSPVLASFSLAPEKEDDRAAQAQIIATLSSAGFRPSAETVSELIGFEVQPVAPSPAPAFPPVSNSAASDSEPNSQIVNRKSYIVNSSVEPPLTEPELAALQSLSKGFAADQLEADADTIYTALADAISSPAEQDEQDDDPAPNSASDSETNSSIRNSKLVTRNSEAEPLTEPEEPVENSCNQYGHEEGCTGATQRAHKGSRASKGNPRAKTTQSNTPLKATPAAKPQAKVNAIDHALKSTQKGGKNVMGAATIDKKPLDILGGHPSTEGSSHAARHFVPGETDRRSLAKSIVLGDKKQDRTETSSVRKDYKAILATQDKGKQARTKLITTRPKIDSD